MTTAHRGIPGSWGFMRVLAPRAARVALGAVFGVAALRKASQPDEALRALAHLAEVVGFPVNWVSPFFLILVVVELLLATFLLFDLFPRASARAAASLLSAFSAVASALLGICGIAAVAIADATNVGAHTCSACHPNNPTLCDTVQCASNEDCGLRYSGKGGAGSTIRALCVRANNP